MTVTPHLLRRYVLDRAAGRSPHKEWTYLAPEIGAWVLVDQAGAQNHEPRRRIRQEGRAWCDVLGHRTAVRDDIALQAYFLTMFPDEWSRLALAVMRRPKTCLGTWRASGMRLIASVDASAVPSSSPMKGPLDGWPKARGSGPRSMLPQ
jgi:hypothetical protein